MSLISEEQIGKILYFNMDNGFGCPSKQYENARYAIHQAIRETAEAAATTLERMRDRLPSEREAKAIDTQERRDGAFNALTHGATEIRRRMGEG